LRDERKNVRASDTAAGAKRRLAIAQARLREIDIAEKEKELLPAADVIAWLVEKSMALRNRLIGFPTVAHHVRKGYPECGA